MYCKGPACVVKVLFSRLIFSSSIKGSELVFCFCFFSFKIFFNRHWRLTVQQGEGRDHLLIHSTISTRLLTFKDLFATLHVRWLSHIFSRNVCIYQTVTQWDLLPYKITNWLIDDVMLIFVCLHVDLILGFCYRHLTRETDGLELASAITLALQANRLTVCVSHPKWHAQSILDMG